MKRLALILLLTGCTAALEQFDANVTPPHDVRWALTGAALDGTLQVAHVAPLVRAAAVVTVASVVRITPWFHKNLDSGFMVMVGAMASEFVAFVICRGPCGRKHTND